MAAAHTPLPRCYRLVYVREIAWEPTGATFDGRRRSLSVLIGATTVVGKCSISFDGRGKVPDKSVDGLISALDARTRCMSRGNVSETTTHGYISRNMVYKRRRRLTIYAWF